MSKMDVYYGALVDYRKNTRDEAECSRQRKYIARANTAEDKIEVSITECTIEEDWIVAIERGLEFVEKAIKEERQFILSNGEVVPIEKAKNVSKESVEHLAKHSNMLTRMPKAGEDLIPDKLYTVERLTDYSVYENRFLYMLLCYLRDFIALRYNAIVEAVTTYSGKLAIHKTFSTGERKTVVQVTLDEKLKNDEYLRAHNASKDTVERIDGLLKAVVSFLSYPLMEEVSKAPMLKPPITETNVLKMNKNFKGAMELYYFVTAYDKRGYELRTETKTLAPFKDLVADEIAEAVELCSFLTYEHGMGIEEVLKANYEEKLKRLREEEQEKKVEQLNALRKRIREHGDSPEEYMLLLEQRNRFLEADSAQLARAKIEIKGLNDRITALTDENGELRAEIAELNVRLLEKEQEIERLIEEHAAEIARIEEEHAAELSRLEEEHAEEIAALKRAHEQEIFTLNEEHQAELARRNAEYEEMLAKTREEYEARIAKLTEEHEMRLSATEEKYQSRIRTLTQEYEENTQKLSEELLGNKENLTRAEARIEGLEQENTLVAAKLNSLKKQSGLYDGKEEYTSREGFDELEKQYNYLKALFKEQWKLTKKGIRKKYLHAQPKAAETPKAEEKKESNEENS